MSAKFASPYLDFPLRSIAEVLQARAERTTSPVVEAVRELGALWQRHIRLENEWQNLETSGSDHYAAALALSAAHRAEASALDLEERIISLSPSSPAEAALVAALAAAHRLTSLETDAELADAMITLAAEAGLGRETIAVYLPPRRH
jgi:hypothetical protein